MPKDPSLKKIELKPSNADALVRFVGELNQNLKFVEKTFDVKIFQNGNNLKIKGKEKDVQLSADALKRLYEAAGQGVEITKESLYLYIYDSEDSIKDESFICRHKRNKSGNNETCEPRVDNYETTDTNS